MMWTRTPLGQPVCSGRQGGGNSLDIKAVKIMLWFYFFEQGLSRSWWFIGWWRSFHLGAVGRGMNFFEKYQQCFMKLPSAAA